VGTGESNKVPELKEEELGYVEMKWFAGFEFC
jgi:hypothetical protein